MMIAAAVLATIFDSGIPTTPLIELFRKTFTARSGKKRRKSLLARRVRGGLFRILMVIFFSVLKGKKGAVKWS